MISIDELAQRVKRRAQLQDILKKEYAQQQGVLLFFAGLEMQREPFYQDSTFFYYVGIEEPGLVCAYTESHNNVLYEPQFTTPRSTWVSKTYSSEILNHSGIHSIVPLGKSLSGYALDLFSPIDAYQKLLDDMKQWVADNKVIFIPIYDCSDDVRLIIEKIMRAVPDLCEKIIDISPYCAAMRRKKEQQELETMYKAIEITCVAHEAATAVIQPGKRESDVKAAIDYIFAESQAVPAFASIIGSGKHSTVLHYVANDQIMHQGDVVVIDIGASLKHYCADISRTYPVSGVFTKRQKEIYDLVLDTQEYIAALAKPGMWISNADQPDKSLQHLAKDFLKKNGGYDVYFPHGIGHFVGLDVHDVGDRKKALEHGDVITIEPGIYIPEEHIGVRIEDMYWIVEDEAVCLSEHFPKTSQEIEEMMRQNVVKDVVNEKDDVFAKS